MVNSIHLWLYKIMLIPLHIIQLLDLRLKNSLSYNFEYPSWKIWAAPQYTRSCSMQVICMHVRCCTCAACWLVGLEVCMYALAVWEASSRQHAAARQAEPGRLAAECRAARVGWRPSRPRTAARQTRGKEERTGRRSSGNRMQDLRLQVL